MRTGDNIDSGTGEVWLTSDPERLRSLNFCSSCFAFSFVPVLGFDYEPIVSKALRTRGIVPGSVLRVDDLSAG